MPLIGLALVDFNVSYQNQFHCNAIAEPLASEGTVGEKKLKEEMGFFEGRKRKEKEGLV